MQGELTFLLGLVAEGFWLMVKVLGIATLVCIIVVWAVDRWSRPR